MSETTTTTGTTTHIMFDATVVSQFLKDGDVIERKGMVLTILGEPIRHDLSGTVAFAYLNEFGGICGGTIPFNVDVPLGTVTEIPDHIGLF